MYAFMHACMRVHVYMYACACLRVHVYMYARASTHVHVSANRAQRREIDALRSLFDFYVEGTIAYPVA